MCHSAAAAATHTDTHRAEAGEGERTSDHHKCFYDIYSKPSVPYVCVCVDFLFGYLSFFLCLYDFLDGGLVG